MAYAVEMFFDRPSDSRIRAVWNEVAVIATPLMPRSSVRPHVSLAVCESVDVPAARQFLDRFASSTPSFPISLSAFGMFPGAEGVAFLAPKVTSDLLALHASFFTEFSALANGCWEHYSPAQWVPHCTLAANLLPQQIAPVLEICRAIPLPLACTVSGVCLVECRPSQELYATSLAKNRDI